VNSLLALRAPGLPDGDFLLWIACSFVVHSLLFLILPASPWLPKEGELPPNHKPGKFYSRSDHSAQIRNGHVSTVHAITACVIWAAWYSTYDFDHWNWQRIMQGGISVPGNVNGDQWIAMGICNILGYFLYDTLCMLYYRRALGNAGSYIHHLAIGVAMGVSLLVGPGRYYQFIFLIEELSTPFLNMKNLYDQRSKAYTIWAALFAFSFFLCRGFFGLYESAIGYWCIYQYWTHKYHAGAPTIFHVVMAHLVLSFTVSRLLNVYWMSLIARKIVGGDKKKKAPAGALDDPKQAKKLE